MSELKCLKESDTCALCSNKVDRTVTLVCKQCVDVADKAANFKITWQVVVGTPFTAESVAKAIEEGIRDGFSCGYKACLKDRGI